MSKDYKVILSLIILFAVYQTSVAQYRFGLTGGTIVSSHKQIDFDATNTPKMGITLGFFYENEINKTMSILTEPVFEQKGGSYTYAPRFDTEVNVITELEYFTIPLLLKANFSKRNSLGEKAKFRKKSKSRRNARYRSRVNYYITGGISLSFLVSDNKTVTATENGEEINAEPFHNYQFKNNDASVIIGVGIMWREVFIDFKYAPGIKNIFEGQNVPDIRNKSMILKLAFSLYHKKSYYGR